MIVRVHLIHKTLVQNSCFNCRGGILTCSFSGLDHGGSIFWLCTLYTEFVFARENETLVLFPRSSHRFSRAPPPHESTLALDFLWAKFQRPLFGGVRCWQRKERRNRFFSLCYMCTGNCIFWGGRGDSAMQPFDFRVRWAFEGRGWVPSLCASLSSRVIGGKTHRKLERPF